MLQLSFWEFKSGGFLGSLTRASAVLAGNMKITSWDHYEKNKIRCCGRWRACFMKLLRFHHRLQDRIRLLQRRLRRRECSEDDIKNGNLAAKTVAVLLAVYVFSGRNLDVAAEFLAFKARPQECCWDTLQTTVERTFIRESTARIVELMNETCLLTWKIRTLSAACLFILQYRLFMWVLQVVQ